MGVKIFSNLLAWPDLGNRIPHFIILFLWKKREILFYRYSMHVHLNVIKNKNMFLPIWLSKIVLEYHSSYRLAWVLFSIYIWNFLKSNKTDLSWLGTPWNSRCYIVPRGLKKLPNSSTSVLTTLKFMFAKC